MLKDEQLHEASEHLIGCWKTGCMADVPAQCRPDCRKDGYAVQAYMEKQSRQPLYGWKIAATSKAGQEHIGVDGPLAGRIIAEMVLDEGVPVSLAGKVMRKLEVEFAFRMGRDLLPRDTPYTVDEVMKAVDTLHLSLELPDSRYHDPAVMGAPMLIADNSCADRFMFSPAVREPWTPEELAEQTVTATVAGKETIDGVGSNVLGGPAIALTWLANELSQHAVPLKAGQIITTGTCVPPFDIAPGDSVVASYGKFGTMKVAFTEDE